MKAELYLSRVCQCLFTIRHKGTFCNCYWIMYMSSSLSEPSASPAKDNYRMNRYKNKALNPEEMRRRREEEGIQLRKQKREQQVFHLSVTPHLCSL